MELEKFFKSKLKIKKKTKVYQEKKIVDTFFLEQVEKSEMKLDRFTLITSLMFVDMSDLDSPFEFLLIVYIDSIENIRRLNIVKDVNP